MSKKTYGDSDFTAEDADGGVVLPPSTPSEQYAAVVGMVAAGTKTLTESGLGGADAGRLALDLYDRVVAWQAAK